MSSKRSGQPSSPVVVRRRRFAAVVALVALAAAVVVVVAAAGGGSGSSSDPAPPRYVSLTLEGRTLARRRVSSLRRPAAVTALLRSVPTSRSVKRGRAQISYQVDRAGTAAALRRAVRAGGGNVAVSQEPVAAAIDVPLIKQVLRDDCEATALSMVLAYSHRPVGQLTLQKQVAHAQPLDPTTGAGGTMVWGDPSLGFVGRADGSGPAGGFGVYQGPIKALAKRHGVALRELSGSRPDAVYEALLHGHPVIAWVALSPGPYASWVSPAGKPIKVNYGEHALVLTGVEGEEVHVNDPLSGTRLVWSKEQFEQMWAGLGRRALAA